MSTQNARHRRKRTNPFAHRDLVAVITACACAWIAGKSGGHVRFQPYARLDALRDAPACAYATTRDTEGASGMVFTRAYCANAGSTEIRRCFVGARRAAAATRGATDARTRRKEREMRRKARAMAAVRGDGEDADAAYEAEVHAMRDWAIGEEMDGFAECGAADARADARSGAGEGERDVGVVVIETGTVTWRRKDDGDDAGRRRKNTVVDGTKLKEGRLGTAVVVVTRDLRAFCFDGSLRELWSVDLLRGDEKRDRLKHAFRTVEVSVLISDVGARDGDAGLVVVGVRSERRAKDGSTKDDEEDDDDDPLQRMTMGARRGRMPNFGRNGGNEEWQTEADLDEDDDDGEFRYFAFEAETGAPRWNDGDDDNDEHRKHEHGRLSLANIDDDEIADASSKACSDFRESIVHDGLPHQWRGSYDTRMRTAHFKRHKSRAMEMERAKKKNNRGNKTPSLPSVHTNGVTRALGRVVGRLQGSPTRSGGAPTAHQRAEKSEHPNVVLSHHSEGIDVLHLYSGARVCGMTLQSPGLHVDLDGDGVIDHVEAHDSTTQRAGVPRCWATVHSGIDSSERVLSASICKGGSGLAGHRAAVAAGHHDIRTVAVAPPVSLRRLPETANELSKPLDRMGRDAIFLNSRGEMTCYNMRDGGQRRWQVRTEANWVDNGVTTPSLTSFSMYVGGYLDIAIATGKSAIVAMNAKGYRAASVIEITTPPVRPLEVTDVDGDGLNDIVLHTQFSTYVWVQRPRLGNLPFTFLVGCLALTMAAAFIYQLADARENAYATGGKVRIVRSTMLDGDVDYSSDDADADSDSD